MYIPLSYVGIVTKRYVYTSTAVIAVHCSFGRGFHRFFNFKQHTLEIASRATPPLTCYFVGALLLDSDWSVENAPRGLQTAWTAFGPKQKKINIKPKHICSYTKSKLVPSIALFQCLYAALPVRATRGPAATRPHGHTALDICCVPRDYGLL